MEKKHSSGRTPFKQDRRGFLKTLGAAVGGTAAMSVPGALPAWAGRQTAAQALGAAADSAGDGLYWRRIRAQFTLQRGLIYMNTGTEGSMPRFILNNLQKDFKDFAAFPMEAILYDDRCCMSMINILPKVAAFLGTDPDEIVMTTNTTEGLGWVANGLDLQAGDEVITSLHFEPYNSCWHFLRDRRKITLTEVEIPTPATDKDEIVARFEAAITDRTKVISFCHINYTSGLRMPVKEICELARSRGITTVVDGAHAIGMIDIDLHDLDCDFYATSPHKWLCAPPGTGVLYMRKESQGVVWPCVTEFYISPEAPIYPIYFQMRGQQTTPAFAGVMDAIEFQSEIGKENIEQRVLGLQRYAKEKILANWGEPSLYSPTEEALSTGLVSFNPFDEHTGGYGDNIAELFYGLWDRGIITRSIGFQNRLADTEQTRVLRLSLHLYNDTSQIDTVMDAIKEIMQGLG